MLIQVFCNMDRLSSDVGRFSSLTLAATQTSIPNENYQFPKLFKANSFLGSFMAKMASKIKSIKYIKKRQIFFKKIQIKLQIKTFRGAKSNNR